MHDRVWEIIRPHQWACLHACPHVHASAQKVTTRSTFSMISWDKSLLDQSTMASLRNKCRQITVTISLGPWWWSQQMILSQKGYPWEDILLPISSEVIKLPLKKKVNANLYGFDLHKQPLWNASELAVSLQHLFKVKNQVSWNRLFKSFLPAPSNSAFIFSLCNPSNLSRLFPF